ncbi:MAG: EF-P lysine aminoacylase GenX [Rickettsiales bacterium]|nr:EF-P lysine aminoacylase GenX [Rickettsiales bacterium]
MSEANAYLDKEAFKARLPFLLSKNKIAAAIRDFFARGDFTEVDTPILQLSPGMEVHLNAFETKFVDISGRETIPLYLHTSPEFAMKKLLSFGMARIYQFAHVFRNEIVSPTHYPEFTMLEWYRAGETYEKLMDDCEEILRAALDAVGKERFTRGDMKCSLAGGIEKLTVRQAFEKFCRFDILATIDDPSAPTPALLAPRARGLGINVSDSDTWDDVFEKLMLEFVEPNLGAPDPTVLYEYPLHQAALSKPLPNDPRLAQRFELYACGVELANAFTELTDPLTQRKRFERDMAEKERLYSKCYPIDKEFLDAVAHMPDCAGIALGLDRLVMLATGAKDIKDLQWVPIPGI